MATKLQDLTWQVIETINKMVECDDESMEERHRAIQHVQKHVEERARQTGGSIAVEELLGEWM